MLKYIINLSLIGNKPGDSQELKLQKQFLVYLALFMSCGGIIWGSISYAYALYSPGSIPYSYTVISIFNLIYFYKSKNFNIAKTIQTGISLLLPFLFQWSLGGFFASGAIMFWAILALLGSITFQSSKTSFFWLGSFLILTIFSGVFDGEIQKFKPDILPEFSLVFLVLNMVIIPSIVFGLMLYIVKKQEYLQSALYEKQTEILNQNSILQEREEELKQNNEEMNTVNEELTRHKANLEQIVEERTKLLRSNESKLQMTLAETKILNNQLIAAEAELK